MVHEFVGLRPSLVELVIGGRCGVWPWHAVGIGSKTPAGNEPVARDAFRSGLRWQPRDNLLLRASAGTGFKAPTLQELYAKEIFSFESVFDPMTGTVVEVPTLSSGNPDLDAEESDNYSLGLVWDVTNAWDMSIDWWRIKNEDAVTSDPQFYVNNSSLYPENVAIWAQVRVPRKTLPPSLYPRLVVAFQAVPVLVLLRLVVMYPHISQGEVVLIVPEHQRLGQRQRFRQ